MVVKVTKYKALDGSEHPTYQAAYDHEVQLKLVQDVRQAVIGVVTNTTDASNRRVYSIDPQQAAVLADLLVMTDLLSQVNIICRGKIS